jgi:8-oxo-dGTP pyrophosphatase MutT (NUDIX family)
VKRALELLASGDLDHVAAVRDRVLAFVAEHPDALLRTCTEGHLTGSALVVDPADGRFVVLHHRKLGRWLQPGGHADGDDDLAAVALREATEETGLEGLVVHHPAVDLDVHEVRPPGEAPHLHLDLRFVVEAPPGSARLGPPPGNDESHEVRWVTAADLDALDADASLRRLVARAERRLAP